MLQTPASFAPLISPQHHAEPLTYLFHQGRLLVRDRGSAPLTATVALVSPMTTVLM